MPDASIGRIVHYVLNEGRSKGQSRPAQVVAVFDQPDGPPLCNLVVTLDGENDAIPDNSHGHLFKYEAGESPKMTNDEPTKRNGLHTWVTSVSHATAVGSSPTYPPNTWHWPEGVG